MTRRLAPLLVVLAMLAGCAGLPSSGPVRSVPIGQQTENDPPVDFTPDGPSPGAAPVEIVRGFLIAMQATPLNTAIARRFLTAESSSTWVPEKGTVVYDTETRTAAGDDVHLDLRGIVQLDGRGSWMGRQDSASYRLHLVKERGQWRISRPPDRLLIPTTHFQSRFNQYFLYFFDKSAQVLVPEPVYVPTGAQAPTFLVTGLLQGPGRSLLGVERSFLPGRTVLDDVSVPVTQDGTAVVPLSDDVLDLGAEQLRLAFAQLAWTLGQLPGVERIRVTVDGSPLDLPGEGADSSVASWSEFDPAVAWASQSLFGIRDGHVVTFMGGEERRVSGVLGSLDLGIRDIAVSLPGEQVAATTAEGTVLEAPRSRVPGSAANPADARTVYYDGTDLLPPAWDLYGQLWVVDRTRSGAVVAVVRKGKTQTLPVQGVTGADVRSFLVSRDGTRFAAVVRVHGRDRLLVARIERDATGRVRRVLAPQPISLTQFGVRQVRDIAWRSAGSIAVLTGSSTDISSVIVVKVDGSSTVGESTTAAESFRGDARDLVSSPVPGAPLLLRTAQGQMFQLAANGRWVGAGIQPGLRSPTFVG